MPREVALDCRYFLGDRPCVWHKQEGVLCTCERFDPIREHILLIKLDAMGDVLRTTALLPLLAQAHPQAAITWVTRPESKPLLENNPYLSEVICYGADSLVHLLARSFDRVINLDAGKISAGLATVARSPRKDGFLLHQKGHVVASNEPAQRWLEMGVFDDLKRANTRTYQSIMAEILDLPAKGHRYVLELKAAEQEKAQAHLRSLGMNLSWPIVGLNTGAGERWQLKQWRLEGYQELIERLYEESETQVLLLGGRSERDRHEWLKKHTQAPLFDSGNDNDLRHFAALTAQCTVVVTGDTLAMHIALATERRVVVLFGPTSSAEIELYGLGEKIVPDMDCLVCYKPSCDYLSTCMDWINADMVAEVVKRQLKPASTRALSLAVL